MRLIYDTKVMLALFDLASIKWRIRESVSLDETDYQLTDACGALSGMEINMKVLSRGVVDHGCYNIYLSLLSELIFYDV